MGGLFDIVVDDWVTRVPSLMTGSDGASVATRAEWLGRRDALVALFAEHVYGITPAFPSVLNVRPAAEPVACLGGSARLEQLTVSFDAAGEYQADVAIFMPVQAADPVPAVVFLNWFGNQSVLNDSDILTTMRRLPELTFPGLPRFGDHATDDTRGVHAQHLPIGLLVDAGIAVVTCYYGDFAVDDPHRSGDGIRQLARQHVAQPAPGREWGVVGIWAWGMSRLRDLLTRLPEIDQKRVAVAGHSRLGKAALWAAAQDPRFSIAFANGSGAVGASLCRHLSGESIADINTNYPHWFCTNFHAYNGAEDRLPIDQHALLAAIAPRPIYISGGLDDDWADPAGEYLSARLAQPAYDLYGLVGIPSGQRPAVGRSIGETIGYHVRPGGHALTPLDWQLFLDFASKHRAAYIGCAPA